MSGEGRARMRPRLRLRLPLLILASIFVSCVHSLDPSLLVRSDREANWAAFEVVSSVNVQESRNFIESIPLYQYWDTLKGSYRMGTIGQLVRTLYPEHKHLTSKVDKKVNHANKIYAVDHHVVDYSQIYMHMLVTVQYLAGLADSMGRVLAQHVTVKRLANAVNVTLSAEDGSLQDLAVQRQVLRLELERTELEQEVARVQHAAALRLAALRHDHKAAGRLDLHRNVSLAVSEHSANIGALRDEHFSARRELAQTLLDLEAATLAGALAADHASAAKQLEDDHAFQLHLLQYRAAQELEYLQAKQDTYAAAMDRRMDLVRRGTGEVVDVLFGELLGLFLFAFGTLESALTVAKVVLLTVLAVVSVTEAAQSLRLVVKAAVASRQKLQSHRSSAPPSLRLAALWPTRVPLGETAQAALVAQLAAKELVLDPASLAQLSAQLSACALAATHSEVCFPNLLFHGLPGCGKTVAAELLVEVASAVAPVQFVILSGADILSLNQGANAYLRDLFARHLAQRSGLLLVVDEADMLIASRTSPGCGGPSSVLYALLEALKVPSRHVGVIFTTRLAVQEVDGAILNRMDGLVRFPLPGRRERLRYLLSSLRNHLQAFVPRADAEEVRALVSGRNDEQAERLCQQLAQTSSLQQLFRGLPVLRLSPEDVSEQEELSRTAVVHCLRANIDAFSCTRFDAVMCLQAFALCSEGWSLRDVHKKVMNVRFHALSLETCALTSAIWMKELGFDG